MFHKGLNFQIHVCSTNICVFCVFQVTFLYINHSCPSNFGIKNVSHVSSITSCSYSSKSCVHMVGQFFFFFNIYILH